MAVPAGATERTPLLPAEADRSDESVVSNGNGAALARTKSQDAGADGGSSAAGPASKGWLASLWSPANRVLLAGFIISVSFSFTQVSILYLFREMECDVFYSNHPPFAGEGDRCMRNEIEAGVATQYSILGITTTFCGTWNLFVSGHQVKQWGPRAALVLQTSIPALRVVAQLVGVAAGGQAGIWIIQLTQVITIMGGPAGYILVVNTIAGEVVPPLERTALFGKLQGTIMLGVATGFLLGGIVGDRFGVVRPFQTAFVSFIFASVYARFAMPYIAPETLSSGPGKAGRRGGLAGFFEPLKVLAPHRIRLGTGRTAKHYGVFFLCCGVFLGVLATGFAPTLMQMYASANFAFSQANNGWLMAGNGFMRAVFLIFLFPLIIDAGRAWFTRLARAERRDKRRRQRRASGGEEHASRQTSGTTTVAASSGSDSSQDDDDADTVNEERAAIIIDIPTEPEQFAAPTSTQIEEEPLLARVPTIERHHHLSGDDEEDDDDAADDEKAAYAFDLFFLRWSLLVDGVITAGAALATRGWHMYLVTVLLPFGSGSAPAAKGVITTMCPGSQRTDALNAITLVENIARLATLGLFGFIFSALASVGQSHLTFYCNGAVAVVAMLVLMLSHFPPRDSTLVEEGDDEEEVAAVVQVVEGEEQES